MARVLWFSRHSLDEDQLAGLRQVCQDDQLDIRQVDRTIASADEIVSEAEGCDCVAVVLPVQLLSDLRAALPDVILAVPRSRRVRDESSNGESQFRYVHDYWEIVDECVYRAHRV